MNRFQPGSGVTVFGADGHRLLLDQEIGKGGEGSVWSICGDTSVVAKFYHQGLARDRIQKIEAMCRLKSDKLLQVAAWPTKLLSVSGNPRGLLMPRISGYQAAHLLYTPKSRRINFPEAQFPFILHASINAARAFATVHDAGQVIGDVNHGNLLISDHATVALIDCDSFEINDGKTIFPCLVGVPTYTPPELQGQSFRGVRRTIQHDAFGLAVLLFHMIFLGRHPFAGIFRRGTADKTVEDAIREYRFAYSPDTRTTEMEPPRSMVGLEHFPADIGQLFIRAFNRAGSTGHRPSAHDWIAPLESLSRSLKRCTDNETHYYFKALASCPWCSVEKTVGRAMFGIKFTVTYGADFDLIAVWAQIESVRPEEQSITPPDTKAYAARFKPDPSIQEIRKRRRTKRLLSPGPLLLAVVIVASGFLSPLPSIGILVLGIASMVKLWHSAEGAAGEIKAHWDTAKREFDGAMRQWSALQPPPQTFYATKRRLQMEKEEFAGLLTIRAQRIAELNAGLYHLIYARQQAFCRS